ncbi:MAG: winged helix-turn-helix domain-containing protein [Candidatus Caldatribacteriota bacterium]|nr:winged helix-turn-helix domain-containing protein [Candidatus Caldatribacteriota bacterium]
MKKIFFRDEFTENSYKRRVIDGKGFVYAENVPEIQRIIIVDMKKNNKITYNELTEIIGKNRKTILWHISVLKERGIIKRL